VDTGHIRLRPTKTIEVYIEQYTGAIYTGENYSEEAQNLCQYYIPIRIDVVGEEMYVVKAKFDYLILGVKS
jgi:hypothetical protein